MVNLSPRQYFLNIFTLFTIVFLDGLFLSNKSPPSSKKSAWIVWRRVSEWSLFLLARTSHPVARWNTSSMAKKLSSCRISLSSACPRWLSVEMNILMTSLLGGTILIPPPPPSDAPAPINSCASIAERLQLIGLFVVRVVRFQGVNWGVFAWCWYGGVVRVPTNLPGSRQNHAGAKHGNGLMQSLDVEEADELG